MATDTRDPWHTNGEKRVGTMRAEEIRRLMESEQHTFAQWLERATKNGPLDDDAAQALAASAARYRHLWTIQNVYFQYPDEETPDARA